MSFRVAPLPPFIRDAKRLSKKYPSLKHEIEEVITSLQTNPQTGVFIGRNCYKIRLSISSKGKGKSGGARIITCVIYISKTVYLLSIYDKSERADISVQELSMLLKTVPLQH